MPAAIERTTKISFRAPPGPHALVSTALSCSVNSAGRTPAPRHPIRRYVRDRVWRRDRRVAEPGEGRALPAHKPTGRVLVANAEGARQWMPVPRHRVRL